MNTAKPLNSEDMLEQLAAGGLGALSSLRKAIDMSLEEVARWIATPPHAQTIRNLAMLLDAQSQLMVCQYRLLAVTKLAEVMTSAKGPETIRRACKDMLTINVFGPRAPGSRSPMGAPTNPEPEPSGDEIIKWLSQFSSWEEYEAATGRGPSAGCEGAGPPVEDSRSAGCGGAGLPVETHGALRRAQTNACNFQPRARADRARSSQPRERDIEQLHFARQRAPPGVIDREVG